MNDRHRTDDLHAQVQALRNFNRYYTIRLTLLRPHYLKTEFSLTEARLLYELAQRPGTTAATLRPLLSIDAGYLSRLLASLTKRGLLQRKTCPQDKRSVLLQLTPAGRRAASRLDRESSLEMERLLAPLPPPDRVELTKCVRRIQEILSAEHRVSTSADVLRATPAKAAEAGMLLNEYYREIGVVQKDTPQSIHSFLTDADSALWIAYMNGVPAGCVVLRPLPKFRAAGECKRLYVRARFRGQGIADTLMEALEQGAKKSSLSAIYLDSKDDLKAALAIYKRRGYKPCKRYNDNPQATVFLKKSLQRED